MEKRFERSQTCTRKENRQKKIKNKMAVSAAEKGFKSENPFNEHSKLTMQHIHLVPGMSSPTAISTPLRPGRESLDHERRDHTPN
mmetsp:Transcript_6074/g.13365  ORF Transcript_6074/g.13365 Transcript_6074/m.13365 type:complete len:85 (+) Transcript_6074:77-331(+)